MNQEQNLIKQPDKAAQLANILTQVLQLLKVMQSPYMTPEKFGDSIGLSRHVVGGWIDLVVDQHYIAGYSDFNFTLAS